MFKRRQTFERRTASLTDALELEIGEEREWLIFSLGRFSIKHGITESADEYYELNAVRLYDSQTDAYPAKRFVYLADGSVCGVLRSEISTSDSGLGEVDDAMRFQMDNGLTLPTKQDKQELIDILEASVPKANVNIQGARII